MDKSKPYYYARPGTRIQAIRAAESQYFDVLQGRSVSKSLGSVDVRSREWIVSSAARIERLRELDATLRGEGR